jgi:hypothetical protein
VIDRFPSLFSLFAGGALAAIAGCAPSSPAAPAPPPAAAGPVALAPTLRWKPGNADGSRGVVEVIGADPIDVLLLSNADMTPDRWKSLLNVRVVREETAGADEVPPLLGTYRVEGDSLRFEPRFPLEPGVRYRAEFDPARVDEIFVVMPRPYNPSGWAVAFRKKRIAEFSMPERAARPSATVTAVYPSRSTLPENLLRFYIHFSAPMSRGEAYRHLRLLDAAGKPIEAPFLELDEELWSGDGKRFTLIFDPGRVKRGLRPHEEVGPVLEAGQSYELVVDAGWADAAGQPLKGGFRKAFRAGPPDETSPDPKTWSVRPPAPATRDPLEVRFPEPLDRALLDRLIAVRDDADRSVRGTVAVADEETAWRFIPADPWRPGAYRLVIGTELEDAAGNNIARPFEVDAVGPISQRVDSATVALPFRIGPAPR